MEQSRRLVRLPAQGQLAGVCAGIADYMDIDVTFVRIAWLVLSIVPGFLIGGLLVYAAAWIAMPVSDAREAAPQSAKRLMRSPTDRKLGGVCGGIAEYLGIDATLVRVAWIIFTIVPGVLVLGIGAYLLAWIVIPERPIGSVPATP